jgi:hypothetical protein
MLFRHSALLLRTVSASTCKAVLSVVRVQAHRMKLLTMFSEAYGARQVQFLTVEHSFVH